MLKNLLTFSSLTLVSRILGFTRDVLIARFFGASVSADVFFVSFQIPNFFRRIFAEGAFTQAFIPSLAEFDKTKDLVELKAFINAIFTRLSLFLTILTLAGVVFSDAFIYIYAPGFSVNPEKFNLASNLFKLTFPYLLFISLVSFSTGILNSYNKFAIGAATPIMLNLSLITFIFFKDYFTPHVYALGYGVLVAGILQFVVQLPFLWRLKVLPKISFKPSKQIKTFYVLVLPAIFGASISQINILVDTLLASLLPHGSISWMYYANRLLELPIGVFGVALSTVILPKLSSNFAVSDTLKHSKSMSFAVILSCLVAIPCSIILFIFATDIIRALFEYGAFLSSDTSAVALALKAYSVAIIGFCLIKVFSSAFFSYRKPKTPAKIGVLILLLNICLNLILMSFWQYIGLIIATSICALVNCLLLYSCLVKQSIYKIDKQTMLIIIKIVLINLLYIFLLYILIFNNIEYLKVLQANDLFSRLFNLSIVLLISGFLYLILCFKLIKEIKLIYTKT